MPVGEAPGQKAHMRWVNVGFAGLGALSSTAIMNFPAIIAKRMISSIILKLTSSSGDVGQSAHLHPSVNMPQPTSRNGTGWFLAQSNSTE
ncbi:hypothetical protein V494_05184 [Pseudogymnoascus sp. VKM F-4513 (FW-928)]|nr:hypothetical protein V494_05184 [Pseudogymnoascus sp. VKM F-4513 (FW-928)]